MKLSISWIFDHIDANWKKVDIPSLVEQFNQTTAEIEGWRTLRIYLDRFSLAQVQSVTADHVLVHSPEWKNEYRLPLRADAQKNRWFLIAKENTSYRWAALRDLGSSRDELLASIGPLPGLEKGEWKNGFEVEDYILDVDNKSITHRPDMWGHRGFAREIAAILDLPMKPLEGFLASSSANAALLNDYNVYEHTSKPDAAQPFKITIQDPELCSRFAGMYIEQVEPRASLMWMASKLARVDSKPIDALVDITNYVMLDLGHPMHAFDANTFQSKSIVIRRARNKEKLTLLDSDEIELTSDDLVIADGKKPISLAGVMGGASTGISSKTKSLFLEAACFDATTVRRSAERHKKRTEASSRFEKSLDSHQPPNVLLRALRFLHIYNIAHIIPETFDVVGVPAQLPVIEVSHAFIEKRLGTNVATDFIIQTLEKLACKVEQYTHDDELMYRITVPSFRATKDIQIKEDIVEEIGRFFGYSTIHYELPSLQLKPSDMHEFNRVREMKHRLAYGLRMREVENYSFYDESFLRVLDWEPRNAVSVRNPISENLQRLVTSLVPHLFKAMEQNVADHDQLRFFEWARVWQKQGTITEHKILAGIMFEQKQPLDFYDAKAELSTLFDALALTVRWEQLQQPAQAWFAPHQTAHLVHEGEHIGVAGMIQQQFLHKISEGAAFAFELDGDFLLRYRVPIKRLQPLSKYPEVVRDISILVPMPLTVEELSHIIGNTDERMMSVTLVDFFEKPEWKDQKALTFRFVLRDPNKTMTKEEVDGVWNVVASALNKVGATTR